MSVSGSLSVCVCLCMFLLILICLDILARNLKNSDENVRWFHTI